MDDDDVGAVRMPPDDDTGAAGLRTDVATGMRWGSFDQISQMVVRLGSAVVLARLIDPADFGTVGLAIVIVNLPGTLSGLGLGDALVQRPELEPRHITTAFTTSAALGIAFMGFIAALAAPLAHFFDQPDLRLVLLVLSAMLFFKGLERTPNDLLARALSFRRFYVSSTIATVASAVFGIAVAVAGGGRWALVAMALSEAVIATALAWLFAVRVGVWRPHFGFQRRALGDLSRFSAFVTADRLLGYSLDNGDNLLVGKFLGAEPLGFYSLAYRVMLTPIERIAKVMATAAFPAFSRVQTDGRRLRNGFMQANRYVAAACMPPMIGAAVTADELVPVVFGDEWRPAAMPLRLMALAGPALLSLYLSGSLYRAIGRPELALYRTAASAALYLPAFAIGAQYGINGVATGFLVASYLILPLDLRLSATGIHTTVRALVGNIVPVVVACGALAGAALLVRMAIGPDEPVLALIGMVFTGGAAYAAGAAALFPDTVRQAARDLRGRV